MTIPFDEDQIDFSNFVIKIITHEINKPYVWRKWQSMTGNNRNSFHRRRSRNHCLHHFTELNKWIITWRWLPYHWRMMALILQPCIGDIFQISVMAENIEKSPKENSEEDEVEEDLGIQLTFSSNCLAYFITSCTFGNSSLIEWYMYFKIFFKKWNPIAPFTLENSKLAIGPWQKNLLPQFTNINPVCTFCILCYNGLIDMK